MNNGNGKASLEWHNQIVELLAANAKASATMHGREYDRIVGQISEALKDSQDHGTIQAQKIANAVIEGLQQVKLSATVNSPAPELPAVDVKVTPRVRLQVPREFDFMEMLGIFREILNQLKKLESGLSIFDKLSKEICDAFHKPKRKTAVIQYDGDKIKKVTQVED